eukprot:scaffold3641_cov50-Phaeocystis_antarctica.AAC.1
MDDDVPADCYGLTAMDDDATGRSPTPCSGCATGRSCCRAAKTATPRRRSRWLTARPTSPWRRRPSARARRRSGRRARPNGPHVAHTLFHCPLSDGTQAHSLY